MQAAGLGVPEQDPQWLVTGHSGPCESKRTGEMPFAGDDYFRVHPSDAAWI